MAPHAERISRLDSGTRAMLEARLRFYRELGLGDLYRRPVETSAWALPQGENVGNAPDPSAWVAPLTAHRSDDEGGERTDAFSHPAPQPTFPQPTFQEFAIPPRKPFPSAPPVSEPVAPGQRAAALQIVRDEIGDCTRCALAAGRNKLVFGDGDPNARLMFVGEGPGADEDASGLPFVGRGGQLLNNMIAAMGLKREQVYIANVVKCRPPQNRTPEPDEAHTCSPFLFQQIDVIRPEVLVALGQTAVTYLTGQKKSLAAWRGQVHPLRGSKLIVTYHPAFLLRDPSQKKEAWADLQIAMRELGLKLPGRG